MRRSDLRLLGRQVRHELVTVVRSPIVLILSVVFPLLFFVLVAAIAGNQVIDERGGGRLTQLLAPGFASFGVAMATFSFLAIGFAEVRASGALKRQNGTPLPGWAAIGGRMGAALLLGLVATALVLAVGVVAYELQVDVAALPNVLLVLVVASLAFSALGLALAALLPTPQVTTAVTNGLVVPLAFVSDIFAFGGEMPAWMERVGDVFPLKPLVRLLADALDPYEPALLPAPGHLAVILAWGAVGAVVAVWAMRRETAGRVARPERRRRVPENDARPRRDGTPSGAVLLGDQVRHTATLLMRDASGVFFAVVFPLTLAAIIPTLSGGGDAVLENGQAVAAVVAMTMAVYGAAVTAYVNMPEGLTEAREQGVLKRMRGTPLPLWTLLAGRVAGALGVALVTLVMLVLVAALVFDVPRPRRGQRCC
ncbi:ABC transporter permease [Cellulomonas sp. APG4]|uniref:ABC transporter permease n=1 Tax=Cellulomonas sp. APG4 TaxID=1538656 RepID=UPI00137B7079|nr:ABC transporter permease [Cellulomonas sp. APG4]